MSGGRAADPAAGQPIGPIGRPGPSWAGRRRAAAPAPASPGEAAPPLVPCPLGRRLACLAIDQAIAWAAVFVLLSVALAAAGVDEEPAPGSREERVLSAFGLAALAAPFVWFWIWNSAGYTPGKRMLGVRIVDERGAPPGVARGFARTAASLLAPLSLGAGYAWAAWDASASRPLARGLRQGWHDKVSGTLVVRAARRRDR